MGELGKSLGEGIRNFKKALSGEEETKASPKGGSDTTNPGGEEKK